MGLGLDGDADRFGIVDKDEHVVDAEPGAGAGIVSFKEEPRLDGRGGACTVPTSHQVDAVAEMLGVKVYETPVGFKYIGALMESESRSSWAARNPAELSVKSGMCRRRTASWRAC